MRSLIKKTAKNIFTDGSASLSRHRRYQTLACSPRIGVGRWSRSLLLLILLLIGCYSSLTPYSAAQGTPSSSCGTPACRTNSINISTGFDQAIGAPYSPPATDGYWQLIDSPPAVPPGTNNVLPSPAQVVSPVTGWMNPALPGSNWITAPTNWIETKGHSYSFQRCFCTCPQKSTITINFSIRVDDNAAIYLDNNPVSIYQVASATNNHTSVGPTPAPTPITLTVGSGEHCLRVDIGNDGGPMGLDLVGSITSTTAVFLSPACCREQIRPCAKISNEEAVCVPGASGSYTYSFTVQNLSGAFVNNVLLTPVPPLTITPASPIPVNLPYFAATTLTVTLNNAKPGDCFTLTLVHPILGPGTGQTACDNCCCSIRVCPSLPDCSCVRFQDDRVDLGPTAGTYSYTFCIKNVTQPSFWVNHIYFYPPPGVTIQSQSPPSGVPNYVPVSLPPGGTLCIQVTITGASPGQFCFGISLHDLDLRQCCVRQRCIELFQINPRPPANG